MSSHPFEPNWTIAPSETLREWLDDNRQTPRTALALAVPEDRLDEAAAMIDQVLARQPLTEAHAAMLEKGTGIPARVWLNLERLYRSDLARGAKDCSEGAQDS